MYFPKYFFVLKSLVYRIVQLGTRLLSWQTYWYTSIVRSTLRWQMAISTLQF